MKIFRSAQLIKKEIERKHKKGKTIGFVPTMGALHEGHLSLVRKARKENDYVVVSIFVNPSQFGPGEDFKRYPKSFTQDKKKLEKEKVDALFSPSEEAMYPKGTVTYVSLKGNLSKVLCGKFRPGHFEGVLTIVSKLFLIINPDRAYFGAKDFQQFVLIKQMIQDLNFPIKLCMGAIIREKDGLALSSRNQYLNEKNRKIASLISTELSKMKRKLKNKKKSLAALKFEAKVNLKRMGIKIQYLEVVDPESLQSLVRRQKKMMALAACFVGKTRLIDNVIIRS